MSLLLGMLKPVPDFAGLGNRLSKSHPALDVYNSLYQTMQELGNAMKLNCHRKLIDRLDSILNDSTLLATAALVASDAEACSIFSTFLTTLEQAYHWPRTERMSLFQTPTSLRDHKLLVQDLHQEELRNLLPDFDTSDAKNIVDVVLGMAHKLLDEARQASESAHPLTQQKQDLVNLLYSTSRGDWDDQGCYNDIESHIEFGHLHETKRTNGGQRSTMELFELRKGTRRLNEIPMLLPMAASEDAEVSKQAIRSIRSALGDLQLAIAAVHDELFDFMLDEAIWGRTFAVFSKSLGHSKIGAGGADTATPFRAVDALIGTVGDPDSSELLIELLFRSRHFPKRFRDLIDAVARARPTLRRLTGLTSASTASDGAVHVSGEISELRAAFIAFLARQHELFTMHTKKAMRIALALRAGQARTSSGVQNAANPEIHIAHALGHAVRVRFGDNAEDELAVDAEATAEPMFYEDDGSVGSARVRFQLSTEIVVRPGDTVSVRVWVEDDTGLERSEQGRWHRRTYSVVSAGSQNNGNEALASTHAMATWVEVAVRKTGLVSSLLCGQPPSRPGLLTPDPSPSKSQTLTRALVGPRLPIRLSVKPAAHFRLKSNLTNDSKTLFVAQGGASGIFLGWLRSQNPDNCPGKYCLIIAARDGKHLAFVDMLQDVVRKWSQSDKLRVVLAFSRSSAATHQALATKGINVYVGYANGYLAEDASTYETSYVCGSATFGHGIVRCLEAKKSLTPCKRTSASHARTYTPITTSTLPPLRLHVAASSVPKVTTMMPRRIAPAELAQHNSPGNLWMAIGKKVYDISLLPTFHPGGEKVTITYAARQAGPVFASVHGGDDNTETSVEVAAMLSEMEIGTLIPFTVPENDQRSDNPNDANVWETMLLDQIVEIQNDLTNHSRFEQRPLGTIEQIPFAPPADVIRGSLDVFVRAWVSLLQRLALDSSWEVLDLVSALEAAHAANGAVLDDFQETVWSREDQGRTARGLKTVFDVHLAAIEQIHSCIDELKNMVWEGLQRGEVLVLEDAMRVTTQKLHLAIVSIRDRGDLASLA